MTEMSVPPGSVIITPYQMYEEIRSLNNEVRHVATLIDPALAELRGDVADNKSDIKAHTVRMDTFNDRIHSINAKLWFVGGVATTAGAGGSQLISVLTGG